MLSTDLFQSWTTIHFGIASQVYGMPNLQFFLFNTRGRTHFFFSVSLDFLTAVPLIHRYADYDPGIRSLSLHGNPHQSWQYFVNILTFSINIFSKKLCWWLYTSGHKTVSQMLATVSEGTLTAGIEDLRQVHSSKPYFLLTSQTVNIKQSATCWSSKFMSWTIL